MVIDDLLSSFQFEKDKAIDNHIRNIFSYKLVMITDSQGNLLFHLHPILFEQYCQGVLVDFL